MQSATGRLKIPINDHRSSVRRRDFAMCGREKEGPAISGCVSNQGSRAKTSSGDAVSRDAANLIVPGRGHGTHHVDVARAGVRGARAAFLPLKHIAIAAANVREKNLRLLSRVGWHEQFDHGAAAGKNWGP